MEFGMNGLLTPLSGSELAFATAESEETSQQENLDTDLPEAPVKWQTSSKQYTITPQSYSFKAKEITEYFQIKGLPVLEKTATPEKPSPMQLVAKTQVAPFSPLKGESRPTSPSPVQVKKEVTHEGGIKKTESSARQKVDLPTAPTAKRGETSPLTLQGGRPVERGERAKQEKGFSSPPLAERQLNKEETLKWWETRYHQRERQGGDKGQDQQEQQGEEECPLRISKTAGMSSKKASSSQTHKEGGAPKVKKPELTPPQVGVFALYYILTKMGILSDGASNFSYKKEIELLDFETTETYQKRLNEVKEAINREKQRVRWGIAVQAASWVGSCVGIISGIMLVATGVGIISGAMLIVGSTIQLANQIMEISGGWQKVAELLPGDNPEQKRAVVNWMQIGIGVLCMALAGAGVIWGVGYTKFGEFMNMAMGLIGGIGTMAQGVTSIGQGVSEYMLKDKYADIKKFDIQLTKLKHLRQDLMEKMDWGVDRLEKLFEDLARALDFEVELFQADQMVNRR